MSTTSEKIKLHREKDNTSHSDTLVDFQPMRIFALTIASLTSALIPQVARTTITFKWLPLLVAALPFMVKCLYNPYGYRATYRAATIWMCNAVILRISFIIREDYSKRGKHCTGNICSFSPNPWGDIPLFALFGGGLSLVVITFIGILIFVNEYNAGKYKNTSFPFIFFILGAFSILPVFIPDSVFAPLFPFFLSLRSLQVIIPTILLSISTSLPANMQKWTSKIFAVVFVVQGPLSLWSGIYTNKGEFFVSGLAGTLAYLLLIPIQEHDSKP